MRLTIFNLLAQEVVTLVDQTQAPGFKKVRWDGRDRSGRPVSSGIFFIHLQAGDQTFVQKMILQK